MVELARFLARDLLCSIMELDLWFWPISGLYCEFFFWERQAQTQHAILQQDHRMLHRFWPKEVTFNLLTKPSFFIGAVRVWCRIKTCLCPNEWEVVVAVANSQSLFEYSSTKELFRVFPLIIGHNDSIKYCCPFFLQKYWTSSAGQWGPHWGTRQRYRTRQLWVKISKAPAALPTYQI